MKPYQSKVKSFFKMTTKPELFKICFLLASKIVQSKQDQFILIFKTRKEIRK